MSETYFVERAGGVIVALYACAQDDRSDPDPLPAEHPEIVAFLNPPAPIPNITRRQLRLWLVRQGIALADVEVAIGSLPEPARTEAQIEWADASTYMRGNPLIGSIGAAIGLSPEQIDDGFRDAATY